MKRLANLKNFTLALVFTAISVISWGQTLSDLSGDGSEGNPYQIKSHTDWNILANVVNGGNNCSGLYFVLKESITLTIDNTESSDIIVGIWNSDSNYKPFSGTFDGDWHTITFNVGDNTTSYTPAFITPSAPFGVITGATIKNLTVTGTIRSTKKYNSGLVGFSFGTQSNIIRCTSDITINCEGIGGTDPDCSSAGFLAENKSGGSIRFLNCVFSGTITKGNLDNANRCAGFVSYNNNDNTVVIDTCTMAGTIDFTSNIATFDRGKKVTRREAYYITNYSGSSPQGTPATTTEPTDGIAKKYTKNANTYYVPGAEVTGLEETVYQYTGNDIVITPVVKYYGQTLTKNTDYTISYEKKNGSGDYETVSTIKDVGDYHFIISGVGNYGGSIVTDMKVIQLNSWAALMEALSQNEGTFDLTQSITAENPRTTDLALQVTGNITLNMNGYTIDRHLEDTIVYGQVIRVNGGASLTINGPGTITGGYSWPGESPVPAQTTYYDKRDAGGIHNKGNLVLNNVNVVDNKCDKGNNGDYIYSARGGGIYTGPESSLVIEGGKISINEGPGGGGGVYCDKANTFTMTGVTVENNMGESKGGGLRILTKGGAIAYLTDCIINMNMVDQDASQGAGVFLEGGELVMTRCDIMGNMASQQGAGFYSLNGTTTAINCNISYNGTFYDDSNNRGAGVCLNDNKGSYHSVFIMDGGTIEANNCTHDGGGIYVNDGAVFQVKGNVVIKDNWKAGLNIESSYNNAYLTGNSVIEVVGELGEDAVINITPSGSDNRTYVHIAEGVSSSESMKHFALDDIGYDAIINQDGDIEVYMPYLWNETTTWDGTIAVNSSGVGAIPTAESNLTINRTLKIPSGYTAYANSVTLGANIHIFIEDGGELITPSSGVAVSIRKDVVAANADDATGWYLISSPVNGAIIDEATNLIISMDFNGNLYDLYRYNEAADLQWENYRAGHADFTTLENGRGYLYRNRNDYTINVSGTLHVSDVSYALSYNATTSPSGTENTLKGFNIIGNPYSHTIYKGDVTETVHPAIPNTILEEKYYVLNPTTGEWDLTDDGTAIAPMTGILVQATETGVLSISNSTEGYIAPSRNSIDKNIWFTVANGSYEDRACVEFKEGHGLNKISHLNEEAPMLYINHNGEYFASIDISDGTRSLDLNFEAMTIGRYTLTVNPQGGFSYLHLIDKVAGKDVDLLKDGEYEFVGSSADDADRFIVRFSAASDSEDDETFAFQDGSDIVVMGEGELQVFDVTGRMVLTQCISGVETIRKPSETGVYILRLEGKTQKILVK
jgi:hypothetical protein